MCDRQCIGKEHQDGGAVITKKRGSMRDNGMMLIERKETW